MLITCIIVFYRFICSPTMCYLDSPIIDKISAADRRGDAAKGEYGHLRVRFFLIIIFFSVCKVYHYYLFLK
jgi:hypothetical protein